MKIFSKIDKEVLITLAVVILAILLISFIVYHYIAGSAVKVQNVTNGAQSENNSNTNKPTVNLPQVEIPEGGVQIQAQGDTGGGTLSVCVDKCGDGVCQTSDPNCGKNNNLACICLEDKQECPQDCK